MRHSSDRRRSTPPRPSLDNDPDGVLPAPVIGGAASRPAAAASKEQMSKKPVAWKDMPQKRQLAILTLSRLSEPLVQTSLQVRERRNYRECPLCVLSNLPSVNTGLHVLPAQVV